jgi:mono/diheme cytochrome c family protein
LHPRRLTTAILGVLFAAAVAAGPADLAAGKAIFQSRCALCHGLNGGGGRGPDLRRPQLTQASDEAALKLVISNGISQGMPAAWYLSPNELTDVAAFVRSLSSIPSGKSSLVILNAADSFTLVAPAPAVTFSTAKAWISGLI